MGFPYNGAEGAENCVLAYIYISSIFEIIDFALAYIYASAPLYCVETSEKTCSSVHPCVRPTVRNEIG